MNILFIGAFRSPLTAHVGYHRDLIPYISQKYNTHSIDIFTMHNSIIDIDSIVKEHFKDGKTIIFFTAGPWLEQQNNKIINHEQYYKLYDVWDQKIDFQLNIILKPNKFNGFIFRYNSIEIDILKEKTCDMDHYEWYFYCNNSHFKNWNQEKIYDVCVYGSHDPINYPLRYKLLNILITLDKNNLIKLRWIKSNEGLKEESLSKEINKSYLTVACKTFKHDRFLGKYQEIPFSYSCILGNIPTRYKKILKDNMVEVNLNMSDNEIANIILESLKDKKLILEKINNLYSKYMDLLTYEQGKNDFEKIIDSIFKKI